MEKLNYSIFCTKEIDFDIAKQLTIKHNLNSVIVDANKAFDIKEHLGNNILVLSGSLTGKEESVNFKKIRLLFIQVGMTIKQCKFSMYDAEEILNGK